MNTDNLLAGVIAVDLGLVTQAQLDECLREQEARLDPRPIGEVFVAHGLISSEQLDRLLAEQRRRMDDLSEARLFGQVALSKGLVTAQQLGECVREQMRAQSSTEHGTTKSRPHLGALLLKKGYLSRGDFQEIIAAQGKVLFHCVRCKGYFAHPQGTSVAQAKCPRCLVMLAVVSAEDDGTGSSTDGGKHDTTQFIKAPLASLGKFEIIGEIARGSMGIVFKAHDSSLDRTVALKVLKEGDTNVNFIRRLHREAALAAKLRHENIVTVHEVGEIEGLHYLCMDFIEGVELVDFIRRRRLAPKQWLRLVGKIARAVHYAHTQGIIHRDLKPSNILVDQKGEPFIMDFGLAKQLDDVAWMTKEGTAMGTPYYMPPEQVLGRLDRIDQRSDVYSLGVILYEIITGGTPFIGESALEIYQKTLTQDPIRPSQLVPQLDPDLEAIVLKAMEKEREHRYATAEDLAFDIGRHILGEAIMARRATPMRTLFRKVRKHALKVVVVAGVAVATLVVAVAVGRVRHANEIAVLEREGQAHYDARRWEDARSVYERIAGKDPQNAAAHQRIGELKLRVEQERANVAKTAVKEAHDERSKREAAAKPYFASGNAKLEDARMLMNQKLFEPKRVNAKLREAIDEFTHAVERDPDYSDAYYLRGRCLVEVGDPEEAIADFTKALALSPQNPGALLERGKIWFRRAQRGIKGSMDEGGRMTLDSTSLDPEDKAKALADFTQATDVAAPEERFLVAGFMAMAEGDHEMAIVHFTRTLAQNAVNVDAVFGRGLSHLLRGEADLAVDYLERALELKPNMYLAYGVLGLAHASRGDMEKAIATFRKVIAIDVIALGNLGAIYLMQGRWDDAIETFDLLLARPIPDRPKQELARASCLYAKGDYARTLEAAERIIERNPQWSEPYELAAVCYVKTGSKDVARSYLKRAIELDPKNAGALSNYASMLFDDRLLDEAFEMATRALEGGARGDVQPRLVRGAVYATKGQHAEALGEFDAAIQADPKDARGYQQRALVLMDMGRYDDAIAAAERVKKVDPREAARADRLIKEATQRKKGGADH